MNSGLRGAALAFATLESPALRIAFAQDQAPAGSKFHDGAAHGKKRLRQATQPHQAADRQSQGPRR